MGEEGQKRYRGILRLLAAGVGLILLFAALIKAREMDLFVVQIRNYQILPQGIALALIAWGIIALEFLLGVSLLFFFRPRVTLPTAASLFLVFFGATVWAWLAGTAEECGCFGDLIKRTPRDAALESAILFVVTLSVWAGYRRVHETQWNSRSWPIMIALPLGVLLPFLFGVDPSALVRSQGSLVQGQTVELRDLELDRFHFEEGEHLIVLMDLELLCCQEGIVALNDLAQQSDIPFLTAFCINEEHELRSFVEEFQPAFPIERIGQEPFWRLMGNGAVPRSILVCNGRVQSAWDRVIPGKNDVENAVSQKCRGKS